MKRKCNIFALALFTLFCSFTLTACGLSINNNENDWGEWIITVAATCETDGIQTRVSRTNSEITETRSVAALGHNWDVWEITTEPTCLVAGVEKRVCKDCGNYDFQSVAALGHDWGVWEIMTEPTCTTHGIETIVCKHDDNHTDIRSVSILGHDWSEWVVTTKPTCETQGVETRLCRNDNAHTETRFVAKLGHDWTGWVFTATPTETTDGEELRICRNHKDHKETRIAYALGTAGLKFTKIDEVGYEVSAIDATISGTVYIPAYYSGLPVTAVAFRGFWYSDIEKVVFLSNSQITHINVNAFLGCTNLKDIEIPESVTHILSGAFYRCTNLRNIEIPENVTTIGTNAFGFSGIESIEISASVTSIEFTVFRDCPNLVSIKVADGNGVYKSDGNCIIEIATNTLVVGIGNSVIPNYVEIIGFQAFAYQRNLESIVIPTSVRIIDRGVFGNCTNLDSVIFASGSLLERIETGAFLHCTNVKSIEIPESVIFLHATAFTTWTAEQTVYIKGFASEAEADEAWGSGWRRNCNAVIVYQG